MIWMIDCAATVLFRLFWPCMRLMFALIFWSSAIAIGVPASLFLGACSAEHLSSQAPQASDSWVHESTAALADAMVTRTSGWLVPVRPPASLKGGAVRWAMGAGTTAREALASGATRGVAVWAWRLATRR